MHNASQSVFIRSSFPFKRKSVLLVLLLFAGIFLSIRYENEITSLVTVEKAMQPFETVAQLFGAGFRIVSCDTRFQWGQQKNYYCSANGTELESDSYFLKNKLSDWKQARWNHWYLSYRKASRKKFGLHVKCFSVLWEVKKRPWFLVVYTVNRDWILQTVARIHEGGFMLAWNDLAEFANSNQDRQTFIEPVRERSPNFINFWKFCSVLALSALLMGVGLLILLLEGLINCRIFRHLEQFICL